MLSWKLMRATEAACNSIHHKQLACEYYGDTYSRWARWTDWWRGFVAGWLDDAKPQMPISHRLQRCLADRWRIKHVVRHRTR